MDYTREPIIETIITPRDGSKLTIRNSKVKDAHEYSVDAVEVVSFGNSFFFRSMERPKSFLLPVSDYEVIETKETRVVLKNASIDKSIKIAGGKVKKESKEEQPKKSRSRRSSKKEKAQEQKDEKPKASSKSAPKTTMAKDAKSADEHKKEGTRVSSSMFRSLFPPPKSLISEKINKEEATTHSADPTPEETTKGSSS